MPDWVDLLVGEASARGNEGKRLYLAQVPSVLRLNGHDYKALAMGRPAAELIRTGAGDRLQIHSEGGSGLFLVPNIGAASGSAIPTDLTKRTSDQNVRRDRFKPAFWAAFIKQLPTNQRRFIIDNGERFVDSTDFIDDRDALEVSRDDIISEEKKYEPDSRSAVETAIQAWVKKNGVESRRFHVKKTHSETFPPVQRPDFFLALESLSLSDQQRISIPLDIVLKALQKR